MGSKLAFSTKEKGASYPRPTTQEELQNWIICASLYWKATGDNAWLKEKQDIFAQALQSMQLRDDLDPARRDGITTYSSMVGDRQSEITTYDAMDASLQHPIDSLYITGKSLAAYTILRPVFQKLGETDLARQADAAETYTAKSLLAHWDATKHMFPALFDGKGSNAGSSIIPAVEGLGYIYAMGLTDDVSPSGRNAALMGDYKAHLQNHPRAVSLHRRANRRLEFILLQPHDVDEQGLLQPVHCRNVLGLKNDATGKTAD